MLTYLNGIKCFWQVVGKAVLVFLKLVICQSDCKLVHFTFILFKTISYYSVIKPLGILMKNYKLVYIKSCKII